MKTLIVTMAPRVHSHKRLELVVTDDTTVAEVCAFALQYTEPRSFSTSQRIAQSILKHFNAVHDGTHETLGVA